MNTYLLTSTFTSDPYEPSGTTIWGAFSTKEKAEEAFVKLMLDARTEIRARHAKANLAEVSCTDQQAIKNSIDCICDHITRVACTDLVSFINVKNFIMDQLNRLDKIAGGVGSFSGARYDVDELCSPYGQGPKAIMGIPQLRDDEYSIEEFETDKIKYLKK
jgi:hypothetical protein